MTCLCDVIKKKTWIVVQILDARHQLHDWTIEALYPLGSSSIGLLDLIDYKLNYSCN